MVFIKKQHEQAQSQISFLSRFSNLVLLLMVISVGVGEALEVDKVARHGIITLLLVVYFVTTSLRKRSWRKTLEAQEQEFASYLEEMREEASTTETVPLDPTIVASPQVTERKEVSPPKDVLDEWSGVLEGVPVRDQIATLANGKDEDVSEEQIGKIEDLYKRIQGLIEGHPRVLDWADYETCRRYLVARQWKVDKAYKQIKETIEWRIKEKPELQKFEESPKCLKNPCALSMRLVGFDQANRPVM